MVCLGWLPSLLDALSCPGADEKLDHVPHVIEACPVRHCSIVRLVIAISFDLADEYKLLSVDIVLARSLVAVTITQLRGLYCHFTRHPPLAFCALPLIERQGSQQICKTPGRLTFSETGTGHWVEVVKASSRLCNHACCWQL